MAYLNSRPHTPKVCPYCGEDVPPKALACPECGSDHNTGWKKDAQHTDGLDLPDDDDDFDYEEFAEREFGGKSAPKSTGLSPLWWLTGILLILAFAWPYVSVLFTR